ncbi:MAG: hypothetical protein H0T77_04765 [Pyrinomonadaceae bacterium]|nr:hypothetical protein [Pyrinomonadaceae bacterium]
MKLLRHKGSVLSSLSSLPECNSADTGEDVDVSHVCIERGEDPRLFYHVGMIARASGDTAAARDYLKKALDLSPQFDPLQASLARQALQD